MELIDTANSAQAQQAINTLQGLINNELRKPKTSKLESVKQQMITNRYNYLNGAIYQSLPDRVFDVVNW